MSGNLSGLRRHAVEQSGIARHHPRRRRGAGLCAGRSPGADQGAARSTTALFATQDSQDESVRRPISIYANVLTWRALLDWRALGFIAETDPLFQRTCRCLHLARHRYGVADRRYGLPGSCRPPFITARSVADHLPFEPSRVQALAILRESPWDGGIVNDDASPDTARADRQGRAFAGPNSRHAGALPLRRGYAVVTRLRAPRRASNLAHDDGTQPCGDRPTLLAAFRPTKRKEPWCSRCRTSRSAGSDDGQRDRAHGSIPA